MLAAAPGERHHVAAQTAVRGLQLLECVGPAVARVNVDGHQARLRQGDADAGLRVALPPPADHFRVGGGVVHAAGHQPAQRGLGAGF